MAKAATQRRLADNEAQAIIRNLRVSPQKLNLVAQSIRRQPVEKAMAELEFSLKRISNDVRKALNSAIANAENNHSLNADNLYVKEAYVGKSFVMKRFKARARGRGAQILKPFSHLTIIVAEGDAPLSKKAKKDNRSAAVKSAETSKSASKAETKKEAPKAEASKTEKSETKTEKESA